MAQPIEFQAVIMSVEDRAIQHG